jgi:hypothetical protein
MIDPDNPPTGQVSALGYAALVALQAFAAGVERPLQGGGGQPYQKKVAAAIDTAIAEITPTLDTEGAAGSFVTDGL